MTAEEYDAEVAFQRILGLAQVQVELMRLRYRLSRRFPHGATITLDERRLRDTGVITVTVTRNQARPSADTLDWYYTEAMADWRAYQHVALQVAAPESYTTVVTG